LKEETPDYQTDSRAFLFWVQLRLQDVRSNRIPTNQRQKTRQACFFLVVERFRI
jgi:hypothetical protein